MSKIQVYLRIRPPIADDNFKKVKKIVEEEEVEIEIPQDLTIFPHQIGKEASKEKISIFNERKHFN